MVGTLTKDQIDHILRSHLIGRIGCALDGRIYIVPVAYAYDGKYIYVHSREGLKITLMRENPSICFEVDTIKDLTNWHSVVISGRYEELKPGATRTKALKILTDRFAPFGTSDSVKPAYGVPQGPKVVEKHLQPVAFRIAIKESTGRYEKN